MKVAGIITEYNPFHNGHKFHIEETRRITGADYVIAVMSGNFVQRGAPAIIDKYSRTLMALHNGVDLVFELPVCYASASAEFFALGAVSLLHKLGIVDAICFGSECGDLPLLKETAQYLHAPGKNFDIFLRSFLREGLTYPAARRRALQADLLLKGNYSGNPGAISGVLGEPNNILGIEYLKALQTLSSTIRPYTILRQESHYHDPVLSENISSATAIRHTILGTSEDDLLSALRDTLPSQVVSSLSDAYHKIFPITEEDFSGMIKYKILSEASRLTDYVDLSADLADRINHCDLHLSLQQLALAIKTKNITLTRVNRALFHMLLNIRKTDLQGFNESGYTAYARVLGLKKNASFLLRNIGEAGNIPLITKAAKAKEQLDPSGFLMLSQDLFASHLYQQIVYEKFGTSLPNEYRRGICIVS